MNFRHVRAGLEQAEVTRTGGNVLILEAIAFAVFAAYQ
jgi:hypothetical protein